MMTSSCSNATPTKNGVSVLLPDGGTMRATHTAELPIPALPYAARQAHLFPALSSGALLSIGQLCDHGCQAVFNASTVNIIKNHKTVLQGQRNPTNGMWVIQLPTPAKDTSPQQAPRPTAAHRLQCHQKHHCRARRSRSKTGPCLQRYRTQNKGRSCGIPSCRLLQSCRINLPPSHQSWLFCHLALTHSRTCYPTSAQVHRIRQRPPRSTTQKCTLHQTDPDQTFFGTFF
jgi:hypothetical protein